ncbi:hypothetical protein Trydic_g16752 [Trypoxylus dichotomus]
MILKFRVETSRNLRNIATLRPIGAVATLSKDFNGQIDAFIKSANILSSILFGFHRGFGSESVLFEVTDYIFDSITIRLYESARYDFTRQGDIHELAADAVVLVVIFATSGSSAKLRNHTYFLAQQKH